MIAQNIPEAQKQLVVEGNTATTDPNVVVQAVADASVGTSGKTKETLSQAATQVTGVAPQEVKKEIKDTEKVVETVTNLPPEQEAARKERLKKL
jgi:antitoxin component of MazEF toxin-antitoxin module